MQNLKCKIYDLKFKKGVTLIEMSVVLAIVLLLIIVGIVEYFSFVRKAVRNDALTTAKAFVTAMKVYKYNSPDSLYPTVITPDLLPFTNVTHMLRKYDFISIYSAPSPSRCIVGRVKDITPVYWINYCAQTGSNNRVDGASQPTCCWTQGGVDCSNDANWYPCGRRF